MWSKIKKIAGIIAGIGAALAAAFALNNHRRRPVAADQIPDSLIEQRRRELEAIERDAEARARAASERFDDANRSTAGGLGDLQGRIKELQELISKAESGDH